MALFIFSTVLFSLTAVALTVTLALWTHADAKAKNERDAVLWVLIVLFINPVGIIVYLIMRRSYRHIPAPGTYRRPLILLLGAFAFATGLFIAGLVGFVGEFGGGNFIGSATVRSGVFTSSRSQLRGDEWIFTAGRANGHERRTFNFSAEQLGNFRVVSDSGEGVSLRLEQGDIVETFDISGQFDERIDMSAFEAGRVRVRLDFSGARDVDVSISWHV